MTTLKEGSLCLFAQIPPKCLEQTWCIVQKKKNVCWMKAWAWEKEEKLSDRVGQMDK